MGTFADKLKAALAEAGNKQNGTANANASLNLPARWPDFLTTSNQQSTQSGQDQSHSPPEVIPPSSPPPTQARSRSQIDWWISVVGPRQADWAIIELSPDSHGVTAIFINQGSGIFRRLFFSSDHEAKLRLVELKFERRKARPQWMTNFTPPSRPWRDAPGVSTRHKAETVSVDNPNLPSSRPIPPKFNPMGRPQEIVRSPTAIELSISKNPRCLLASHEVKHKSLRRLFIREGSAIQLASRSKADEHEVTIGLDFGTSATKVVIGDSSLTKSFAVPFCVDPGVDTYLLPTRLFERSKSTLLGGEQRSYSLHAGADCHRDLKLRWLASPDSRQHQERVIAFLSLVLRHARGWLFHEYASVYKSVTVAWRVAIGLPSATVLESGPANALRELVLRAWIVSCIKDEPNIRTVDLALDNKRLDNTDLPVVDVIPEIAAQVFGFVTSNRFDRKAVNRYLLVDIGAGTVDSSLFRVHPERGRKWNFDFFTAVVQPNGASNLHVQRVNWWSAMLSEQRSLDGLIGQLTQTQFFTDIGSEIPESFQDYLAGVRILNSGPAPRDPDLAFLTRRLIPQVRGDTLCRARDHRLLDSTSLKNIPMFLCGGGSRMSIYQRIASDLVEKPGITWPTAKLQTLEIPSDLEVETALGCDYDRLSVAYGLSRIDAGKIRKAIPVPDLEPSNQSPWSNRYVDKDQI